MKPYVGSLRGKQACLDGKTLCGASWMGELNIHMVSAWIHKDRISMELFTRMRPIECLGRLISVVHYKRGGTDIDKQG